MSFKIIVSNTVKFKVRGTIKDESGADMPFDFTVTARRLDTDTIRDRLSDESESKVTDFLASVVEDWAGVKDADDKPIPYSEEALRAACRVPGIALLMFQTYFSETSAKAKN